MILGLTSQVQPSPVGGDSGDTEVPRLNQQASLQSGHPHSAKHGSGKVIKKRLSRFLTTVKAQESFTSVVVVQGGKKIVLGTSTNNIKVWNLATMTEVMKLSGHSGRINSVVAINDGEKLVSGSDDCSIKIWDLMKGGLCIATLQEHEGPGKWYKGELTEVPTHASASARSIGLTLCRPFVQS